MSRIKTQTAQFKPRFEFPSHLVETAVNGALLEDLGVSGDITTLALVDETARASAVIRARSQGVICGLEIARATFKAVDPDSEFKSVSFDGDSVKPGSVVARVQGTARGLLTGERVALNFIGRLSGIASLTRSYVQKVSGLNTRIVDTRKTTPGQRGFEKYAVRCGGGHNHRAGLFDAMMIKDNHIVAAGGIKNAIERARTAAGHMVRIEVEVDTLDQLCEVLEHTEAIDAVLLDNMDTETLATAVKAVSGRLVCEASGGVSLSSVAQIARTGVDIISVGALTHSACALDVGFDFENAPG